MSYNYMINALAKQIQEEESIRKFKIDQKKRDYRSKWEKIGRYNLEDLIERYDIGWQKKQVKCPHMTEEDYIIGRHQWISKAKMVYESGIIDREDFLFVLKRYKEFLDVRSFKLATDNDVKESEMVPFAFNKNDTVMSIVAFLDTKDPGRFTDAELARRIENSITYRDKSGNYKPIKGAKVIISQFRNGDQNMEYTYKSLTEAMKSLLFRTSDDTEPQPIIVTA